MKVNVYETVEVTDEDRKKISNLLGVRQATRDQLKEFLWQHGKDWREKMSSGDDLESLI